MGRKGIKEFLVFPITFWYFFKVNLKKPQSDTSNVLFPFIHET
jgi:hypothetical protein